MPALWCREISTLRRAFLEPTTKERAFGRGHHSPSGTMTRRSDASNEWVICLFDFTGKDCHINAINPGESHGSRCTVHHWLHSVLGTDLSRKQQSSSQSHSDRDAQLISRLDSIWLAGGLAMGRHRQLRRLMIEEWEICPGSLKFVFMKPPGPTASKRIITSSRSPISVALMKGCILSGVTLQSGPG
jgi:hypothetical protein